MIRQKNKNGTITGQGLGTPEPVRKVSERAGSHGPSSSVCSAPMVGSQAMVLDTATGQNSEMKLVKEGSNPFQKSGRTVRSPEPEKRSSMVDTRRESYPPSECIATEDGEQSGAVSCQLLGINTDDLDTDKERALYKALMQEREEKQMLVEKIRYIEARLSEIEQRTYTCPKCNRQEENNQQFETDEEDVRRETEWIVHKKKTNKKRKASSSPPTTIFNQKENGTNNKQEEINVYKKPQLQQEDLQKKTTIRAPPPIYIAGVKEHSKLQEIIKDTAIRECKITALNNNVWKINCPDPDSYRALAKKLDEEKIQWHTYEDKNERPLKVMARGLHPTCDKNDIIQDLESKGFNILDAVNILKKENKRLENGLIESRKRELPLFMLTFKNSENINKIYSIQSILNIIVKIEPIRRNSKLIPQCKNCQEFNHTQSYCRKEPRCVKCAGKHLTRNCTISRNTTPKCINCKGAHPASYRGCEVAKELQRMRDSMMKTKRQAGGKDQGRKKYPLGGQVGSSDGVGNAGRKLYSQITSEAKTIEERLKLILDKINEQESTNKKMFDKINRLEISLQNKVVKNKK